MTHHDGYIDLRPIHKLIADEVDARRAANRLILGHPQWTITGITDDSPRETTQTPWSQQDSFLVLK